MDDSHDPIAKIVTAYRRLCEEHRTAKQNITLLQEHQKDLVAQASDCFAAARLFGFDLLAETERAAPLDDFAPVLPETLRVATISSAADRAEARPPSIKTLIISAMEKAHPRSLRAADIRRNLLAEGRQIHEKTVGMSLYRLSQTGIVRRVGADEWYFVPESERALKPLNGHAHSAPVEFFASMA